jgi:hypothetical protein
MIKPWTEINTFGFHVLASFNSIQFNSIQLCSNHNPLQTALAWTVGNWKKNAAVSSQLVNSEKLKEWEIIKKSKDYSWKGAYKHSLALAVRPSSLLERWYYNVLVTSLDADR